MNKNLKYHLIITILIIIIYGIALLLGKETETLKNIILIIMGYWFRSMEKSS